MEAIQRQKQSMFNAGVDDAVEKVFDPFKTQ